jgi:hypothetical protein
MCASTKEAFQLYISDIRLSKIFQISRIIQDEEKNVFGHVKELWCFERSSVLMSLSMTQDGQYLLVGDCDDHAPGIHICNLNNLQEIRTVPNIPGPMGIAVTEERTVFVSSSKEHALERTGKNNTNGPDMTVARCTRQSFRIVLDSLTSLSNTLTEIGKEDLLDSICFESLILSNTMRVRLGLGLVRK